MKNGAKEKSVEEISTLFNEIIEGLDLNKAPKFYLMSHLLMKLMSQEKREKLVEKVNFKNISYIPSIKDGLSQKLFCDFLTLYSSYLSDLLKSDKNIHLILDECVDTNKFTKENLMKKYDISYLLESLVMARQGIKLISIFMKLGDYFYLEPKTQRIETNLVGLIMMEVSRLYDFVYTTVIHFDSKIVQVDSAFSLSLYEVYCSFTRVSRLLADITPKLKEFSKEFMISLPEVYKVDIERNQIIEKSILEINKQGIVFNKEDFYKKLDLPVMPGNIRKESLNYDLMNQGFFKLSQQQPGKKNPEKRAKSLGPEKNHNSNLYLEQQELKVLNNSLDDQEESKRNRLFTLTQENSKIDINNKDLNSLAYEI